MYQREKLRLFLISIATFVLVVGSIFIVDYVRRSDAIQKERDLSKTLDLIAEATNEKILLAEHLLYDLRGLLMTQDVTAQKWEDFILINELETRYPGVYSMAYAQRVTRAELPSFEDSLRATDGEKYKNYTVFPKTNNSEYFPIKLLHTMNPEIAELLGFDFRYSEKSITTFTDSLLTGQPSMSELLHLDVVIPKSKELGYEIVLPVYSGPNAMLLFPEERKKFLSGFVGAWISPENLKDKEIDTKGLRYSIYDSGQKIITAGEIGPVKTSIVKEVQILNRKFKFVLESDNSYVLPGIQGNLPTITVGVVTIIILLWLFTVYSIMTARRQAINLATMATKDLRKFKMVVDNVSDHVVITDPEGVILYANKAATEITGYSLEEMLGQRPSLWGGQMTKEFYQNFWKTIKIDKKSFWGEVTNRRKNGELYESELKASPILDEKGKLIFFVANERDLSKFRAVEKMKSEFISLASHQLRTPLSAVKWFGEMLMDGDAGKLTESQKEYVKKINESNEKEIQLVNALLNVSRIESGKIVVIPRPTDLRKMVEDILTETKVGMVGLKKKFEYEIDKNLPEINVDADLIKLVYANLIANAMKYTQPNGKITVRVYIKGEDVITEVQDNGIGIPKKEQERIFEKFFRGSNALKKETEGNGLGLFLTKTIVESSGGKLWFESEEGKGSTFSFSIPLKKVKGGKEKV